MLFSSILTFAALATSAVAGLSGSHDGAIAPEDHPLDQGPHSHNGTHDCFGNSISRRGPGVYWCTKNNWRNCQKYAADNVCSEWNTCTEGSIGPDKGAYCTVWRDSGCKSTSATINWPGTGSVRYDVFGSDGAVDCLKSWKCHT